MAPLCFAYYCSGHGYGHATRVSAFASHLLGLDEWERPTIYIISSAPQHVFADSIALGAIYRYAEIDPVIVQPLAYRVDRQKSLEVLKKFLGQRDYLLQEEQTWLRDIKAKCVLSDAAALACLAAKAAGIPSILITNFTFDSVYSYLSTTLIDTSSSDIDHLQASAVNFDHLVPDTPLPASEVAPLVDQLHAGYRCADLLLLLPGYIPIPSFSIYPSLPSTDWIDPHTNTLRPAIEAHLQQPVCAHDLHPPLPPPHGPSHHHTPRMIVSAPLLVRAPTASPSVHTPAGRSRLLTSIGIPPALHDPAKTKILVVSFGGQTFHRPSRTPSRSASPARSTSASPVPLHRAGDPLRIGVPAAPNGSVAHTEPGPSPQQTGGPSQVAHPRLATPSHIWIPGAPPAARGPLSPTIPRSPGIPRSPLSPGALSPGIPTLTTEPPTPDARATEYFTGAAPAAPDADADLDDAAGMLPDASWIAVVCGVSRATWNGPGAAADCGLPPRFFVAPRDVYMPDLTAAADVLLGKLGYGTVAECVDAATPFVYVSRPLFIEEHGLRRLLAESGTGVELPRQLYEAGEWAGAVADAWEQGRAAKAQARAAGAADKARARRAAEGAVMARDVMRWVRAWWMRDACVDIGV